MKKYHKNMEIFIWCCELSLNSGEGKLALTYIQDIKKNLNKRIILRTPELFIKKFNINNFINNNSKYRAQLNNFKYLTPFIGIFFCWLYFFKKKQCCFINYLPLWNSFLFLFLPPRTILGPITGGALYQKHLNINYILRNYIFKFLYKISLLIIFLRHKKIIFATSLLKNEISSSKLSKCYFDYIYRLLKDYPLKPKNIDILLYNRKHPNKIFKNKKIVEFFLRKNMKIHVIGAHLCIKKIHNHGYITNKEANSLLSRSKFTINSQENFYTLFLIEALSNKVKILTDRSYENFINKKNDKIFINLNKKNIKNVIFKNNTKNKDFKILYSNLKEKSITNNELRNYFVFS
jgi:hypothetical protein